MVLTGEAPVFLQGREIRTNVLVMTFLRKGFRFLRKVFRDTGRILGRFITPPRPRKDIKCQVSKKKTKSLKRKGICLLSKKEACLIGG